MSVEKNDIPAWAFDERKLLDELANDISREFWIEKNKAQQLIKEDTLYSLDSLKSELNKEIKENKKLNNKELEKLFFTLKWALDVIEKSSKLEIKTLKEDIENNINIEDFKNHVDNFLPPKLILAAKNPQKVHEHILGFALGTANSIFTTVEILYQIWKWILQSPYHLYMIISGKGQTDSFKNI